MKKYIVTALSLTALVSLLAPALALADFQADDMARIGRDEAHCPLGFKPRLGRGVEEIHEGILPDCESSCGLRPHPIMKDINCNHTPIITHIRKMSN